MSVKDLRKAGGTWRAEQLGFAYYAYHGDVAGHQVRVQSYSHCTIGVNGGEEYESRWHVTVDGHDVPTFSWGMVLSEVRGLRRYGMDQDRLARRRGRG